MKSSKTSFLRNCISGWNVRSRRKGNPLVNPKKKYTFASKIACVVSISAGVPFTISVRRGSPRQSSLKRLLGRIRYC